jgi:hypothetical protein
MDIALSGHLLDRGQHVLSSVKSDDDHLGYLTSREDVHGSST